MNTNQLPKCNTDTSETGCCPRFDPAGWDNQTIVFDHKKFLKTFTRSFMYIPFGMDKVMAKAMKQIDDAGARGDEFLMLACDASPWKCGYFITVTKDIPDAEMAELSGTYLTKTFEGPYQNVGKWYKEMQKLAQCQGKTPIKTYFYYTTCPKCAKVFGKNHVVGFVQVA